MVARIKALHAGIVLAGGLFVSSSALGLVLGDITLSSALNEPLEASIELGELGGLEAGAITVTVGDQAAYDRANVERPPFLDNIRFTVEVDNENAGRIVLTSTEGVTEPFLNLIVAVAEPDNVTLKDYTLLVQLPADSEVSQAEVAPAEAGAAPTAPDSPDTYVINSGDTLWEIAQNTRPDSSVSVQQMMVAIQRENSDAFIGNNINRLINGRVLRIPSLQDIRVIDQQSAIAQVSQQAADLGGQPLAAGNTGAGGGAAAQRDQLSVLSGDDVDAGGGSSDLAATIAALENELMLSEENLDRARIENLELNNRLSSLQEQIDLLENIIAIEDGRIAELQAELARQTAATETALASADTAATELADISEEPPSTLNAWLRDSVAVIGAVFVLALAVLGLLVYRRRQAQAAAEERSFNPALSDDEDAVEDAAKVGFLAGLLARFRRNKDADDDDDDYDYEAEASGARQEPGLSAAPQPVAPPKKDSTDHLLDEMGISEEMLSLDDALDSVDSASTEPAADVFEPREDGMGEAESEADAQSRDSDYALTAADEAFAAIAKDEEEDQPVDFTTTEEVAPVDVPAAAVESDDTDTFEFTLKDLPEVESAPVATASTAAPDVETFDFKLTKPVVTPPERTVVAAPENIEVIAFPGTTPAKSEPVKNEPVAEEDDLLDLGDLSFDDTMVADDAEEESQYKPRTGNECDTKLDLATAYEAMGDVTEAIEILDEVIAEGSPAQVETAQRLKQTWQSS